MAVLYLLSGRIEPRASTAAATARSDVSTGCRRSHPRRTRVRTIQIAGGRIIDPSQDIDRIGDLWLSRGRVLPIGRGLRGGRDRHRRPGPDRLPGPDRRPRPPPRAGQRGGRDDRHRRRGGAGRRGDVGRLHAQHDPRARHPGGGRVRRPPGAAGAARRTSIPSGPSARGARGRSWPSSASSSPAARSPSPTTARRSPRPR